MLIKWVCLESREVKGVGLMTSDGIYEVSEETANGLIDCKMAEAVKVQINNKILTTED